MSKYISHASIKVANMTTCPVFGLLLLYSNVAFVVVYMMAYFPELEIFLLLTGVLVAGLEFLLVVVAFVPAVAVAELVAPEVDRIGHLH